MTKIKEKLVGKRIVLKLNKPDINLAKIMFETTKRNIKHLSKWMPWSKNPKVEDTFKYLISIEEPTKKGEKLDYGIYINDKYAGNIGAHKINKDNKWAEIGYWIHKKQSGKGYTTEAVLVLEKELFTNLKLNRIQLLCDEKNIASAKVAKKCGYTCEGMLRQDEYSKHFKNFRNTFIFSKLKSEYKNK